MMAKRVCKIILVLLLSLFKGNAGFAQNDSTQAATPDTIQTRLNHYTDSVALARQHFIEDSLTMLYIKYPDPSRPNLFVDSILKHSTLDPYNFGAPHSKKHILQTGKERPARPLWIMAVVLFLLIYMGLLNLFLSKDIYGIIQAFYNKRAFANLANEDNLLTSWTFIALFSLFGLTLGLYLYQYIAYKQITFDITGFQLFIALSLVVLALFGLKILVLRLLGFIFDIGRLVKEYISILFVTYFNLTFIFLPLVVCFSLISGGLKPYLLLLSACIIIAIFAIQYLRSAINIISKFRFRKIYLFLYLCALEICPILILIKALDL